MNDLRDMTIKLLRDWEELGKKDTLVCPVYKADFYFVVAIIKDIGMYDVALVDGIELANGQIGIDGRKIDIDADAMTGIIITRKEIKL